MRAKRARAQTGTTGGTQRRYRTTRSRMKKTPTSGKMVRKERESVMSNIWACCGINHLDWQLSGPLLCFLILIKYNRFVGWCDRSSCSVFPVPSSGQRRAKARAPLPRRRSANRAQSEARLMQTKRLWCHFITSMREKHFILRLKTSMYRTDTHVRDTGRKWGGKDSKECIVSGKQMGLTSGQNEISFKFSVC